MANEADGATSSVSDLETRLQEAEDTLAAIRNGEVDAVVVGGPNGQQVYTLENADRPYRVIIEQMHEGAVTLSDDGTVLYCNQRFSAIVDAPRSTIIGGNIVRFFAGDEGELFQRLLARPGAGAAGEFDLSASDFSIVPVNISLVDLQVEEGMPRVVCGVITDLTQNRRRSLELAAANERLAGEIEVRTRAEASLELALEAAGMGSWDLDLGTELMSRTLKHDQIFGYPALQPTWTLQQSRDHYVEEDKEAVFHAVMEAFKTGSLDFEARIKRAGDGEIRWLRVQGQTYFDGAKPVRITGVIDDITERRAIEEQLRQSQKMEAVGQLTGGIAHDFNNLLTIIGGSLEMLSRRVQPDERTGRLFEAARQGVARGAKLNQQLLAFSRRQDLRMESVCVDELVPAFEHLLDRAVGEAISVQIEPAATVWYCRTDPHQLETAILNLAINARDAMPDGGTLRLTTTHEVVDDATAENWGASGGEYVVITVGDTGAGMPPEVAARVFEPFFTTKEVGKGTGLGLSQVYGFAKQSDGFVTLESQLRRGTSVSIHLPRTHLAKSQKEMVDDTSNTEKGDGTVLVVEDDPIVRETTVGMLHDLGYITHEAETGRKAIALLDDGLNVDLVFSDVIMPDGMSGVELAQDLAVRRPNIPVLLTSGYTAQRVVPEALANDLRLLRKPYSQSDLSDAIRQAMKASYRDAGDRVHNLHK